MQRYKEYKNHECYTFAQVELHIDVAQLVESSLNIEQHRIFLSTFDDQVVDVYLQVYADLAYEGLIHQALICCSRILEAKGHLSVTIDLSVWTEGGPVIILLSHLDLVVPSICVQEAFEFKGRQRVHF